MSLSRACPVCAGGTGRPLWHEGGHRYILCGRCSAVFSDLTHETYARLRHNAWDEAHVSAQAQWFYRDARAIVHREFLTYVTGRRPAGRLLDVGCGLGVFMQRAREYGWAVHGCDPSPHWVRHARELLGDHAAVMQASVLDTSLDAGRYDLITLWDVLEHIYDPLPALAHLRTLLAPGGRVFIRTPNIAYVLPIYSIRRSLLGHAVELGPLNHVVYFHRVTMGRALGAAGLSARKWPVFLPPQVPFANGDLSVRLKNGYARVARRAVNISRGTIVPSADLDVFAEVARAPSTA